jgi:hypothetical protein
MPLKQTRTRAHLAGKGSCAEAAHLLRKLPGLELHPNACTKSLRSTAVQGALHHGWHEADNHEMQSKRAYPTSTPCLSRQVPIVLRTHIPDLGREIADPSVRALASSQVPKQSVESLRFPCMGLLFVRSRQMHAWLYTTVLCDERRLEFSMAIPLFPWNSGILQNQSCNSCIVYDLKTYDHICTYYLIPQIQRISNVVHFATFSTEHDNSILRGGFQHVFTIVTRCSDWDTSLTRPHGIPQWLHKRERRHGTKRRHRSTKTTNLGFIAPRCARV